MPSRYPPKKTPKTLLKKTPGLRVYSRRPDRTDPELLLVQRGARAVFDRAHHPGRDRHSARGPLGQAQRHAHADPHRGRVQVCGGRLDPAGTMATPIFNNPTLFRALPPMPLYYSTVLYSAHHAARCYVLMPYFRLVLCPNWGFRSGT